MALNPQIPLMGQPPPQQSVLQSLGQVMALKNAQQTGELNRMKLEEARQAEADETAMREALSANVQDPDRAVDLLVRTGRAPAAFKLSTLLNQRREQIAKATMEDLKAKGEAATLGTQILAGVKDEPTFAAAKVEFARVLGPDAAAYLGDHYDSTTIALYQNKGTKTADYLRQLHYAVQEVQRGLELARQGIPYDTATQGVRGAPQGVTVPLDPQVAQHYRVGLGTALSLAQNKDEWDITKQHAKGFGVPESVLVEFGEWAPGAPKRAGQLAMTPQERQQAETAARNAATAEGNLRERQRRGPTGGGGAAGGGTISSTQKAVAERWLKAQLARLERDARPDPKEMAIYREDVSLLSPGQARPNEPAWRMTPEELDVEKLRLVNSYRTQIGLDPVETLEEAGWTPTAEVGMQLPSVTSATGAVAMGQPPSATGGASLPTAPPATAEPSAEVAAVLKGKEPGRYTMSDGTKWRVKANGAITRVQ